VHIYVVFIYRYIHILCVCVCVCVSIDYMAYVRRNPNDFNDWPKVVCLCIYMSYTYKDVYI